METIKDKKIGLIFRKKLPFNNSIEELFNSIYKNLDYKDFHINRIFLDYSGASLKSLLFNLKQICGLNHDLLHITGDVHYVSLATRRPTILTIHDIGSAFGSNIFKNFVVKIIWFWLPALFVNRITVISEFSKKEFLKLVPFASKKIIVIPNPVSPLIEYSPYKFNSDFPTILHLGTKSNKNLERTIEALEGIKCKLVIIGQINSNQKNLLIKSKIKYENDYFVEYDRIIEYYKKADIVCFVSTYEGFGMPIIEAQKTGRPVITSNISSMPDVVGENACLVNPYNIKEINRAFINIINNQEYRNKIISAGLENVKRFEIERITQKYIQVYRDILKI